MKHGALYRVDRNLTCLVWKAEGSKCTCGRRRAGIYTRYNGWTGEKN